MWPGKSRPDSGTSCLCLDAGICLGITGLELVAQDLVQTEQPHSGKHLNMGYHRLSPFSPRARNTIKGIYEDLAKSAQFNGIIFHDDATLSDYEDASSWAKKAYQQQGLATDLAQLRADDAALQKWTAYKVKVIDDFAMELAETVRQYQPYLQTSRNLYAQVALSAYSENWYAQSLEQSLNRYDFTAIMAMPYMEQVDDPAQFYQQLLSRVQQYPQGLRKRCLNCRRSTGAVAIKFHLRKLRKQFRNSIRPV